MTAVTQARGASLEVPWGRATSNSLLDSGAVSPSSLIRVVSSQKRGKTPKELGTVWVSGVGGVRSKRQASDLQPQLLPLVLGGQWRLGGSQGPHSEDLRQDYSEKAEGRWPTEDLKDSTRVPWGARNLGHVCPLERPQQVISFQTLHFTNVDTRPREGSGGPGFLTCHGTTYKKNFL